MTKLTELETWWGAIERQLGDRRLTIALLVVAASGALGIAVACEIGVRVFNTDWNQVFGYTAQRDRGAMPFFTLWIGTTLAPLLQGLVGGTLTKVYAAPPRPYHWQRAMAVAIVGSIPMYVAGLSLIFLPGIMLFAIAFVVSCGWWASGNRGLLGLKYSESPEHVAVSLLISGGLLLLVSASIPS